MTTLNQDFLNKVGGAGNGKGLEAQENRQPEIVVKQGLSGTNNGSAVPHAMPAFPPMSWNGQK